MKIAKRLRFDRPRRPDPITRHCQTCGAPHASWGFDAWIKDGRGGTWFCFACQTKREDEPMTITVLCVDYKPLERGTLQGFCTVRLKEVRLLIKDVAIHEKDGKRWAQLPSKPRLDANRELVKGPDGKILYTPVLEFDSREVADAFSRRVLDAVAVFQQAALGQPREGKS